jgi:hypothetical protein
MTLFFRVAPRAKLGGKIAAAGRYQPTAAGHPRETHPLIGTFVALTCFAGVTVTFRTPLS